MKWRWNCQNFSLSLHLGRQFQLHGSPVSGRDSHTLHSNVHEVLGKGLEENSLFYPLNSTMCVHMKFTLVNKRDNTAIRQRRPPIRQKPVQTDGLSNTFEGQQILNLLTVSAIMIDYNLSLLQLLDLTCTYLSN